MNIEYCPNLFALHDTRGVPLAIALGILRGRGMDLPASLAEFVSDARKAGWADKTLRRTVKEAVLDNWSVPELADIFFGPKQEAA